jgi:lysophospholipase L1-like esterase
MKAFAVILVGLALAAGPAQAGYPHAIAAIGDSITRAYNTEELRPFADGPAYSWSTGTKTAVGSAYLRIVAASPGTSVQRSNVARDGAEMKDFTGQARDAVRSRADYVTVMLGSNDVCGATEAAMPSPARFAAQFDAGMKVLTTRLPEARIQVVSIPNLYRLWSTLHRSLAARLVWRAGRICQSLLAHGASRAAADEARRLRVRSRLQALNTELARGCARYVHCRYDGGAVFATSFAASDVSTRDFFHPSRLGQAKLAAVVWRRTFDFSDAAPPRSTAVVTPSAAGDVVTISAVDDVGVAGVEYRTGTAVWARYSGPLTVAAGTVVEYRAVDVDGNSEAEQVVIA